MEKERQQQQSDRAREFAELAAEAAKNIREAEREVERKRGAR